MQCIFFKVLVEEKKPKPPVQEPPKKLPTKPDEAIAVPTDVPPKKGIDSLFVYRAILFDQFISLVICYGLMCNA